VLSTAQPDFLPMVHIVTVISPITTGCFQAHDPRPLYLILILVLKRLLPWAPSLDGTQCSEGKESPYSFSNTVLSFFGVGRLGEDLYQKETQISSPRFLPRSYDAY